MGDGQGQEKRTPSKSEGDAREPRSLVGTAAALRQNILGGNERVDAEPNDFDELLALVPLLLDRIEELEEALRCVLDVTNGWTRSMSPGERMTTIERFASESLRGGDAA